MLHKVELKQVSQDHEDTFIIYKDGIRKGFMQLKFNGKKWHWTYQCEKFYELPLEWNKALEALESMLNADQVEVLRLKGYENA